MLILARKVNEEIVIPELEIVIRVTSINGKIARLGIEAPKSVAIFRAELLASKDKDTAGPRIGCREQDAAV